MQSRIRPTTTIGERLATADAARFVGRRAELERLERLLVEVPERNIVLLHGSGGIGKSTLLRELVRRADRAGWPSRIIEARDLPEQPRGLQAVLDDLRSSPRALVVYFRHLRAAADRVVAELVRTPMDAAGG